MPASTRPRSARPLSSVCLQAKGGIDEHDMFNTFNMGVGMIVVVSPETAEAAIGALKAEGIDAYVCGEIVTGEEKVCLC